MKRTLLIRKTPLKRTPLKRGNSSLKRTSPSQTGNVLSERDQAREDYLRRFRGLPCEVCGKTHFAKQKSTVHHVLKAELWPEHYFEDWNRVILCPVCHVPFAHDKESDFLKWLMLHKPEQAIIIKEHRHHRKETK